MSLVTRVRDKLLDKSLKQMGGYLTKVGYFGNAQYPGTNISVAAVATIQEFGSPKHNIPPRPFMRPTIDAKRAHWQNQFRAGARSVARGKMTPYQVMDALGLEAASQCQQKISSIWAPPLKPATIAARYRRVYKPSGKPNAESMMKPLVDTGLMLASLISVTEKKS